MIQGIVHQTYKKDEIRAHTKEKEWSELVVEVEGAAAEEAWETAVAICKASKVWMIPRDSVWLFQGA